MIGIDKRKVVCWENLKIDELVTLKDEQTLEFLMDQGVSGVANGADFAVKRKRVINSQDGSCQWIILDIELGEVYWFLIVKSYGDDFDINVCFMADGIPDGSRHDFAEQDSMFIFDVPETDEDADDEEVDPYELDFILDFEDGDGVKFKTASPIYGTSKEAGENDSFATVVEYTAEKDCENPLAMVMEFNAVDEEDGEINNSSSYLFMVQGCQVSLGDVELLK